jgi:hypothetical protein
VFDNSRSSADQDAFEKALWVSFKNLGLRTEAAHVQGRVKEYHQLCNFRVSLGA